MGCQVATVEEARGSMLQQGGFNTCMELATEAHPEKTRTRAIHAIAKVGSRDAGVRRAFASHDTWRPSNHTRVEEMSARQSVFLKGSLDLSVLQCLVTTNPHVLSERQRMNPIPPMLWLCRQSSASNLQQFECLLGLTNLASAGDEVRPKWHLKTAPHKKL